MSETPIQAEEESLAKRASDGDEEAFAKLYETYLPKIFAYISRRVGDRDEVEDLVSNIFLRMVEHIKTFDPKKSRFKTWIYTIATNMMIDYFRSRSRRKSEPLENAEDLADTENNPHQAAEQSQHQDRVFRTIHALPDRQQKILLLKYYSDLTIEELADAFDVTINNASVMLHRALKSFEVIYNRYE